MHNIVDVCLLVCVEGIGRDRMDSGLLLVSYSFLIPIITFRASMQAELLSPKLENYIWFCFCHNFINPMGIGSPVGVNLPCIVGGSYALLHYRIVVRIIARSGIVQMMMLFIPKYNFIFYNSAHLMWKPFPPLDRSLFFELLYNL